MQVVGYRLLTVRQGGRRISLGFKYRGERIWDNLLEVFEEFRPIPSYISEGFPSCLIQYPSQMSTT